MSYREEDPHPSELDPYRHAKGVGDDHWARGYRGIGTRILNWNTYASSSEHCQCPDCGYYWPIESGADYPGNTRRRGGRCWQCWMASARPEELRLIKQATSLARPVGGNAAQQDVFEQSRKMKKLPEGR